MDRIILHVDFNAFYASVECFLNPSIRDKPVIVCGDAERRSGIVLAKNELAKRAGIVTGDTIWQAQQKASGVVQVKANFDNYLKYSKMGRELYGQYTDKVEPFGLDEAWLDITGRGVDGEKTAHEIRRRITREFGLTVSVGVSFNKIFAKLGSDLKKPDAVSCITRENYRRVVWDLPAQELLYVGKHTQSKLKKVNINTIGDIARAQPEFLQNYLGKAGLTLYRFANGMDDSPVKVSGERDTAKSIGNSTTSPRDLENIEDVRIITYILSESVAARLRSHKLKGCVVGLSVRDCHLQTYSKQLKLDHDTNLASEIAQTALLLFEQSYSWDLPVRSMGVSVSDLRSPGQEQVSLFEDYERQKCETLECAIDEIRRKFGTQAVMRCLLLQDKAFTKLNPQLDYGMSSLSRV